MEWSEDLRGPCEDEDDRETRGEDEHRPVRRKERRREQRDRAGPDVTELAAPFAVDARRAVDDLDQPEERDRQDPEDRHPRPRRDRLACRVLACRTAGERGGGRDADQRRERDGTIPRALAR